MQYSFFEYCEIVSSCCVGDFIMGEKSILSVTTDRQV